MLDLRTERDWTGNAWDMTRRQKAIITILGKPLGAIVPESGDRVTIEGATYDVTAVDRDPAAATYSLTVVGA